MDFSISEERRQILEAVDSMLKEFSDEYWAEKDEKHEFPWEFYHAFARNGYLGMAIPEEYGGAGLTLTDAALVLQRVAGSGPCHAGATAVHISVFGMTPVVKFGSEEMRRKYLPPLVKGDLHVCFGVTEPDAGTDTTRIRTFAENRGDHYVVNGGKIWTSRVLQSDLLLLLCRTERYEDVAKKTDGITVLLVDLREAVPSGQIEVKPIKVMSGHHTNQLFINDLVVPVENRIGDEGKGFRVILSGLNAERILAASQYVGSGLWFIDRAVTYANEREVFGRPIGMNQGIQFPLADSLARLDAAELILRKATWLYDNRRACGREANMAKYLCADAGFGAADRALQTHGGMGYSEEYHISRFFRESRLMKIAPVSQEMILNFLGANVLGLPKSY